MCVCVCVCVDEFKEKGKKRKTKREIKSWREGKQSTMQLFKEHIIMIVMSGSPLFSKNKKKGTWGGMKREKKNGTIRSLFFFLLFYILI